jgi:hypothetical protein
MISPDMPVSRSKSAPPCLSSSNDRLLLDRDQGRRESRGCTVVRFGSDHRADEGGHSDKRVALLFESL